MPTQLQPVFSLLLLVPVTVPLLQSTAAAVRIPAEDVIRTDVSEYETSLDVDDFVDNFAVPEVSLHSLGLQSDKDPLLRAGKFEGDIAGFAGATPQTFRRDPAGVAHNAVRDSWHRWVDGQIPYVLSSRYGRYSRKVIARAMDEFHKKTCVRFIPRERLKHRDYVYIEPEDGCYSMVGRMGGRQPVSLDAGCMEVGIVVHELMHTAGFFHEQSRTDRDNYIRIIWRNILPGASDQFDKYDSRTLDFLGAKYDYDSIMHYGPYAFSRNGLRTIEALKAGGEAMGQRKGFSATDIYKLNKLYSCDEHSNGANEGRPEAKTPPASTAAPIFPTRKAIPCENKKWECYFWKWLDHCKTNKAFMRENCLKACGWCTDDDGGTDFSSRNSFIKPSATRVPKKNQCEDANGHCKKWSKAGYCDMIGYRHFMAVTCAESCGKCSSSSFLSGTDGESQHIPSERISSTQISDYDVAVNGSNSALGCTDSEGFRNRCQLYATWGMCQGHNKAFMEKVCPKSCKFCLQAES